MSLHVLKSVCMTVMNRVVTLVMTVNGVHVEESEPTERTHSRFCPVNPRNAGNRTGGVGTSVPRAKSPSPDCLDSEGEGIVHCESPKTFAMNTYTYLEG